jgi:hypothetical protein
MNLLRGVYAKGAVVVLALGSLAAPSQVRAQTISGNTPSVSNYGVTECLYNTQSECWDVKNDDLHAGTVVWLYGSSRGNALGWTTTEEGVVSGTWPFSTRSLDAQFQGDKVYFFHKTDDLGLVGSECLGQSSGNAYLEPCYQQNTYWVKDGNNLVNPVRSDYLGGARYLLAGSNSDQSSLTVGPLGGWHQWKIRFCC